MRRELTEILHRLHQYNPADLAYVNFGLRREERYDALVVAPSYAPGKLLKEPGWRITELGGQSYCTGYLVQRDGFQIAWIKTAAGGCNMLDYLLICGELTFDRLIFVGAVGALKPEFEVGDICTPSYSIDGTMSSGYLKQSLRELVPFERVCPPGDFIERVIRTAESGGITIRRASVFCTDSIVMEYAHLDEIKAFDTDLIEMETAAFYGVARLMDVPAVALLVVSDNSSTGVPLVGRDEAAQAAYERARSVTLPALLLQILNMRATETG